MQIRQEAWAHLATLHHLGPRILGTSEHAAADALFWRHLGQADWRRRQRFAIDWRGKQVFGHNLWGRFMGQLPGRLMLAVRYDAGSYRRETDTQDFAGPAVNEAASGAAILMALATLLAERRERPTVDLVFLDGGSASTLADDFVSRGAETFLQRLPDFERPDCVIFLGAVAGRQLMLDVDIALSEHPESQTFSLALFRLAAVLGLPAFAMTKEPPCRHIFGEHRALVAANLATCVLTDCDYPERGTPDDTFDACREDSLGQVAELLEAAIFRMAVA